MTTSVFQSVVCAVDGTPEGDVAAHQGARLVAPGGAVHLIRVASLVPVAETGWIAAQMAEDLEKSAHEEVERLAAGIPGATHESRLGPPWPEIEDVVRAREATLLCVGSHGTGRLAGIVTGSVATSALHEAPCSVLVARGTAADERFPHRVTVGLDGSDTGLRALATAREIAERFGAELYGLVSERGEGVDLAQVEAQLPGIGVDRVNDPVEALVRASQEAHLLIVGSRGLRGLKSLGSVSERVAHEAACSVLVVRAV